MDDKQAASAGGAVPLGRHATAGIFCRRHADQWGGGLPFSAPCTPSESWVGGRGESFTCEAKIAAGSGATSAGTTSGQVEGGQRGPLASSAPSTAPHAAASSTEEDNRG